MNLLSRVKGELFMKKTAIALLLVMQILFCTACASAGDPDNLFEMSPLEIAELADRVNNSSRNDWENTDPYFISGNWQKPGFSEGFVRYGNAVLFIELNQEVSQFMVYTMNLDTHEINLFCKDATCDHQSKKCAVNGSISNLMQYNGKTYSTMAKPIQIDEVCVVELKNGRFEPISDTGISSFWFANGKMYALTKDNAMVVFEKGGKSPRILLDECICYQNVAFGDYLYAKSRKEEITRTDLTAENPKAEVLVKKAITFMIDGTHIYYVDRNSACLYRCNMDGSEVEVLTEVSVHVPSLNFDGEYVYFTLQDEENLRSVYRLSKTDPGQPEELVTFPEDVTVYSVYTVPEYENLIVETYSPLFDENGASVIDPNTETQAEKKEHYLVSKDRSTMELLKMTTF